jgi:uncharacterized repeat protein (TIGR01451 family)
VKSSATGSLSNTATVAAAAGVSDSPTGNNTATDTDTITLSSDLVVGKTGPASAFKLNAISYTVVVTNNGPSDVTGASVTDTMPAGLSGVTWTCTATGAGSCGAASGSGNISTTVDLPAGQKATFTVSATVSASAPGSITNTATASAPAGTTDPGGNNSSSVTTTVNNRLVRLTYTGVASAQYSDPAYLRATLMDVTDPSNPMAVPNKTITFALGGQTFTAITDATGTAATGTMAGDRLNQPAAAAAKTVATSFGGDTLYAAGNDSDPYTVNLENANVTDIQPTAVAISSTTDNNNDGKIDSLTINLTVKEPGETPTSFLSSSLPSGIGLANAKPITVTLSSVSNGSVAGTCSATNTTYVVGSNDTATASCNILNVPVDVYQVDATITGDYFTGTGVGALDVYNPALGFATGGGWFKLDDGTRMNFGFTAKYLKSGQIQGSVLTIFHHADGNYIIKSNALGNLAVSQVTTTTPSYWIATLTGKATYAIPSGTLYCGVNKCGGYTFTMYAEDRAEPGAGVDKYWFQLKDPNTGQVVAQGSLPSAATGGAAASAVTIVGGNIQIPHN